MNERRKLRLKQTKMQQSTDTKAEAQSQRLRQVHETRTIVKFPRVGEYKKGTTERDNRTEKDIG